MNDEHLKKIQEDVDLMNKSFDEGLGEPEEPPAPVTQEPPDDPPATDPPVQEPETDPPATSGPRTEPPSTDAPKDERDEIIEDLRRKLADKEAPKTKPPTTDAPVEFEEMDFLEDADFEDITSDPKSFNKFVNKVYQTAVTDARKSGQQPPDITSVVTQIINLQKATDEFYNNNEDLAPFKKAVAATYDDLVTKSPDKAMSEIFADVATETRKRLNLPDPSKQPKPSDKDKPPRLPGRKRSPGKPQDTPKPDPLLSEIDEMTKSIGR